YFMYELAERLEGSGVTINAISPGFFVNTTIYRNMTGIFMFGAKMIFGFGTLFGWNTPQRSAKTYVWLATDPALEQTSARYFEHRKAKDTSDLAKDISLRKKLWAWSVKRTDVGQN
ncbi:MAG: hypothetical protein ACR2P6_00295, partial [Gammaproteobacteria bacterium]